MSNMLRQSTEFGTLSTNVVKYMSIYEIFENNNKKKDEREQLCTEFQICIKNMSMSNTKGLKSKKYMYSVPETSPHRKL